MNKYIQIFLMVWVYYYTPNDQKFIDKLNSLDKNIVDTAHIQLSTYRSPHQIIYWEEKKND